MAVVSRSTQSYELQVIYVDPSTLKPDPRNGKVHPKRQLEQLQASIRDYGFVNPILCDEAFTIIAGHGRLLAAKAMLLASVPAIVLQGLTEIQKRALRIADNKIAENGAWDLEILRSELADLVIEAPDLELGIDPAKIDVLLATPVDPDEEFIPATPLIATSRLGDLWRLDGHRLLVGDCADREAMTRLMDGRLADCVVGDPPYNQPANNIGNKGRIKHRPIAGAAGELTSQEFEAWLVQRLGSCAAFTRDGGVHYIFMDHQHAEEVLAAGRKVYGARLNICIWNKSNAGMGALYRSKHEMVHVFRVGQAQHLNAVQLGKHGRHRPNVWDAPSVNTFGGSRQQDLELHPTVKPVKLIADAILDVTRRGDVVLDGFLGSGTTLIACERTGRLCHGAEIDPLYADVILQRFATLTGIEPVLEATGETFVQVRARRAAEAA